MKRTGTAKRPLVKGESLHDRIDTELLSIKRNSALVRSFFSAEHVSYISDLLVIPSGTFPLALANTTSTAVGKGLTLGKSGSTPKRIPHPVGE